MRTKGSVHAAHGEQRVSEHEDTDIREWVCFSAVYTVYDEWLEQEGAVRRLAVGLVNHSCFQESPDG